jgi:hypothetical protein
MPVKHPDWCDPTECAVPETTGQGTHVSRKFWIKGRDQRNAALFIEHSTESRDGPRVVASLFDEGLERSSMGWPADVFRDAVDEVLALLEPGPPGSGRRL